MSSQQPNYLISAPASIRANSLTYSDVESIVSLNEDKVSEKYSISSSKIVHPEFAFSDGNIEVQTRDKLFWVHEFQLRKFTKLAQLIDSARAISAAQNFAQRIKISCDASGIDFANALQVVYASVIKGQSQFDKEILASALRISTTYGYAELREFATAGLEKANLTAIDRIRFSDEFVLPSWEKPAFMELCQRREAITPSEAKVLGMDRFVEIARIREAEQRHQLVGSFAESVRAQCLSKIGNKKSADTSPSRTSVLPSLPGCDCSADHMRDPFGGKCNISVTKCKMHEAAPQILAECQSLLKERRELQDNLKKVTTILASQESKARSWGIGGMDGVDRGDGYVSLESELGKAAWIRSVHTN